MTVQQIIHEKLSAKYEYIRIANLIILPHSIPQVQPLYISTKLPSTQTKFLLFFYQILDLSFLITISLWGKYCGG